MNIYISGSWLERPRAAWAMNEIEKRGHEVAYDWARPVPKDSLTEREEFDIARDELRAVMDCDLLWLLFPETESRGSFVELGMGLVGSGEDPIITGPGARKCIFSHLCEVYPTDVDGLTRIDAIEKRRNPKEDWP